MSHIERLRTEYFWIGTQYYVAGRFGAFARLAPVSGNLLHHAVELYLKGHLSRSLDVEKLKNNFRHDLTKLWPQFKEIVGDTVLDHHDSAIATLHRFEEIRYPDRIVTNGMEARISIKPVAGTSTAPATDALPTYEIVLETIDDLVCAIVNAASVNWTYLLSSNLMPGAERQYLFKENRFIDQGAA